MTGEKVDANALEAAMTAYSEQMQGQPDRERLARAIVAYSGALPDATAEMPGEREVARAIATFRKHLYPDTKIDVLPSELAQAAAVMALFAPILAEKDEHIAMLQAMVSDSLYSKRQALEARALAAEAALAAERERGARLLIAEYEAQTLCLLPILGEALKWRRRVTEDLKELIPYVARIAAPGAAMEAQ